MKQINGERWMKDILENNMRCDLTYTLEDRETAQNLIHEIALETERTYQTKNSEKYNWFEIVNHDADNWSVTVYFEDEKPQDEPDEFEHLKTDGKIPIFDLDEAMKYFTGNAGPSFKTEIQEEPCRGSLDVGPSPINAKRDQKDDIMDAATYPAKLMSEKEIAKQQSFEEFRSREDHKAYSRYCKMMLDSGQTPALFEDFKNWARQL